MKLAESRPVSFAIEERRIRATYARRRKGPNYAWSNPAHVFIMQGVERRLLPFLAANGMASLSGWGRGSSPAPARIVRPGRPIHGLYFHLGSESQAPSGVRDASGSQTEWAHPCPR